MSEYIFVSVGTAVFVIPPTDQFNTSNLFYFDLSLNKDGFTQIAAKSGYSMYNEILTRLT